MNVKDFYNGFAILSETKNERLYSIRWAVSCRDCVYTTYFYRHMNGTWHMDPDSKSYGLPFARVLKNAVTDPVIADAIRVPLTETGRAPELDRIESILKKEEMYRKQLRRSKKEEEEKNPVRVWFAKSIRS